MNEEIKKFWEESGYEIEWRVPVSDNCTPDTEWRVLFFTKKDGSFVDVVGVSKMYYGPPVPGEEYKIEIYNVDNKSLSEEQMLRVLKLKAFL